MITENSERDINRFNFTALAGHPCDPLATSTMAQPVPGDGKVVWSAGNPHDVGREYCVDPAGLNASLRVSQLEVGESLGLSGDGPPLSEFLERSKETSANAAPSICYVTASSIAHTTPGAELHTLRRRQTGWSR